MKDRYFFLPDQLSEQVVPHVDVLGVGVSNGVLSKLPRTLIVLEYQYARLANSR